ncbi:hypothetical protein LguiA_027927 [Lonicera macranthoides]
MAFQSTPILGSIPTTTPHTYLPVHRPTLFPSKPCRTSRIVSAAKKLSPITGKFDSNNNRRGSSSSTREKERMDQTGSDETGAPTTVDDGYVLPELPGDEPDFWEGPQWDAFGFFIQYLWAFGIVFALISSGIAVATYNEGATDFKETPAYKESIQSQELLEEPEESNSDVFESNPTEEAPNLE